MIHAIRTLGGHRRFFEREIDALTRGETWEPPGGWPPERDHLAAPVRTLWPPAVTGSAAAVRNRLQTSGVATVGELAGHTADDLRSLGLRPPQIDEVRLALYRRGLALQRRGTGRGGLSLVPARPHQIRGDGCAAGTGAVCSPSARKPVSGRGLAPS